MAHFCLIATLALVLGRHALGYPPDYFDRAGLVLALLSAITLSAPRSERT